MTALGRKRRPSSPPPLSLSARWANPPLSKIPKLNHLFDGTGSRSMESTSTGRSKLSVKSQFKRGVSSIKTVLGMGDRSSGGSMQYHHETTFPLAHENHSVYLLANESNTTTIHQPLKIRLTAIADNSADDGDISASPTIKSAPSTPRLYEVPENEEDDSYGSLTTSKNGSELSRSQSAPGLQRRISQKFQQAFGNGNSTIVKRSGLRSRPSVQTLLRESAAASSTPCSSTPPTLISGTSSSINGTLSTPQTSEPLTPSSTVRRGCLDLVEVDQQKFMVEGRLLSPIPESINFPFLTIRTVEAAATTKIFFELHFNSLFQGTPPRASRRKELEKRMRKLQLPPDIRDRIRTAWEMAESENLRQRRVLKNTTSSAKASQGVSIGGFEVINVLGKGSFGVVRLVKAKNSGDGLQNSEIKGADKVLINAPSRSSLKSSGRLLSGSLFSKRKDATKARKEVYAMKVIRKSDMIRNGQEGHLRAERDFLVAAEGSRWVIPLIAAFQDQKHLYLVMEYCIGGDFLGLLIRKNTLSEEFTKFYIAEMILCVEEAHRMQWIHRDVKPDNFLIGFDGHLKISDFGLAFNGDWSHDQRFYQKTRHSLLDDLGIVIDGDDQDKQEKEAQSHHASRRHGKEDSNYKEEPMLGEPILDWRNRSQRRRLARSVVGTSQYMAPEWSIAVIMYECLFGFTPFACDDRQQTKLKILQHKKTLMFPQPEGVPIPSMEALDLMMQILVEKEKRLCSRQYEHNDFTRKIVGGRLVRCVADKAHQNYQGYFVYPGDAEDIKRHAWFANTNWDTFYRQRPPYEPRVRDWEDTKYFDEEDALSDMDSATTLDEVAVAPGQEAAAQNTNTNPKRKTTQLSHHQAEGQNIVPSSAMNIPPPQDCPGLGVNHAEAEQMHALKNPLMQPRVNGCLTTGATLVDTGLHIEGTLATIITENVKPKAKKREKKRPRDIILRDPAAGAPALEARKLGAFMGYEYRQPTTAQDIIEQVVVEEMEGNNIKMYRQGCDQHDPDLTYERRVYMDAGGQLFPRQRAALV
ncbi:hypothetical protein AYO20_10542 [Fonsecaea nubica]|uniref:non-specific serine/threonine protein kinase n=1 Tax=Fonsecaea nubica TaxID=856822 RepID=A0A178C505_9EURO|nr:hypothetical protein AYO20_10542 [Fonsecaea nubica]OAL25008.1 hypothetical protein AYO20_10542 [Fonsecaea nubica]